MAKVMLATGLIVGYGYVFEAFMGWYSGSIYEKYSQVNRMFGPYAVFYWALIACNVGFIQVLWFKSVRSNPPWLFLVSLIVLVGMWLERYIIVVTSLHRDYLPSSWGNYSPTVWDWTMYLGTIGFFLALMFLFVRLLPMISIAEMQTLLAQSKETGEVT